MQTYNTMQYHARDTMQYPVISNTISQWQCIACYESLKKSMQRQKTLTKRQEKRKQLEKKSKNRNSASTQSASSIPKTMRALVKETESKGYVLKTDYPVPTPKEDEILVRSFAVSICGSDTILYNWTAAAQTIAKLPFIPGIFFLT